MTVFLIFRVFVKNLGSFLMEFEAGESIIPPEMSAAYDHDEHALPSFLHRQRAKEHGEWVGFNANSVFNDGLMVLNCWLMTVRFNSRPYHWICENRMHAF